MCLSCQICATKMVTTMNTPLRAPEKDNFQERKSRVLQVILEGCAFVRRRLKIFLRSAHVASGFGVEDLTITETFLGSRLSSSAFLIESCFTNACSKREPPLSGSALAKVELRDSLVLSRTEIDLVTLSISSSLETVSSRSEVSRFGSELQVSP